MRRLIALLSALLLIASAAGVVAAGRPDLSVVFDASRAHVYWAGGVRLAPAAGSAAETAAAFLATHGRDAATIASLRLDSQYASRGITHLQLHQEVAGLRIAGAYAKVALNARGEPIHAIDNLFDVRGSAMAAAIGPARALAQAMAKVHPGVAVDATIVGRDGRTVTFRRAAFFRASPTAESVLLARESGRLEHAFLVTTWSRAGNLLNRTLVDALGGVAAVELRTARDSYNVYTEDPLKTPQGVEPGPGSGNTESPSGWLTGSQTTVNIGGNNAHAYLDTDANNQPDPGGTAVTDGNFLAVSNLGAAPSTAANQAVAVQNLFFLNNVLHDTLYAHGFTEAAGNFQENNFGNGGADSDSVNAEAQDGSGTDNANFATPGDGQNPTMQMYLWTPLGTHEVVVGASQYDAVGAAFGPAWSTTGITAPIAEVNDGTAPTSDGCEKLPRNTLSGQLALVDRGTCTFATKVKNAQAAGALGVIVAQNSAGAAFAMGASGGGFRIPSMMVSQADGASIRAALPSSGTARLKTNQPPMIDADVDSDVVYHEYGHGLTWRMIGSMDGPMSGAIGEGASDALAMFLNGDDRIGEYSASDPNGIRTSPYGSMTKTYSSMTGSEVHADGEVYGRIGWLLLQDYLNAGRTVNDLLDTWIDGFTFTPAGPAVTDMRDGMLAASTTTAEDCLIWDAFATVGVGVGATATVSRRGVITATDSFVLPPECTP